MSLPCPSDYSSVVLPLAVQRFSLLPARPPSVPQRVLEESFRTKPNRNPRLSGVLSNPEIHSGGCGRVRRRNSAAVGYQAFRDEAGAACVDAKEDDAKEKARVAAGSFDCQLFDYQPSVAAHTRNNFPRNNFQGAVQLHSHWCPCAPSLDRIGGIVEPRR